MGIFGSTSTYNRMIYNRENNLPDQQQSERILSNKTIFTSAYGSYNKPRGGLVDLIRYIYLVLLHQHHQSSPVAAATTTPPTTTAE